MENKKRVLVTPQQLGHVLFVFALKTANDFLKDKKTLKEIGINKIEKGHLFREIMIINMFCIIEMFQGFLKDENLENDILDFMHKAYYQELVDQLKLDKEQIINEYSHSLKRYDEYKEAMKEKRGPNWLWPLTNHMLNNLRKEEVRDLFAMTHLTIHISSLMNVLPDMINKYQIERA